MKYRIRTKHTRRNRRAELQQPVESSTIKLLFAEWTKVGGGQQQTGKPREAAKERQQKGGSHREGAKERQHKRGSGRSKRRSETYRGSVSIMLAVPVSILCGMQVLGSPLLVRVSILVC